MMDGGYGGWGEFVMFLLSVVFIAAIIIGAVFLVRSMSGGSISGSSHGTGGGESPRDILKRRYAAGEIEREEYEQKLRDLSA
jgi:putative membrane protein